MGIPTAILNPFFWIIILMVWGQYKKTAHMEMAMFGVVKIKPEEKVLYAILFGIIGGLLGGLTVMILGISITEAGLVYVWPIAILLMLIDPHLMCFSYAGGLVSLFSLITGLIKIDVAGLMALVAVLHLVESLLIYFGGHINASPVFIKDDTYDIIGGFSLQEFWPVPIMMLTIVTSSIPMETVVPMPDWWPLIKPPGYIKSETDIIFMMIPIVAALGYGDIALSTTPKLRCKKTGKNLLLFSVSLLILSVMASRYRIFLYIAAIFAPVAHELLIISGRNSEKQSPPLFRPMTEGEKVLDVVKDAPGDKMDLEPGDLILEINGKSLASPGVYESIMAQYPTYLWITYKKLTGEIKTHEFSAYPYGINSLGIILVPRDGKASYVVREREGLIKRVKRWLKRK